MRAAARGPQAPGPPLFSSVQFPQSSVDQTLSMVSTLVRSDGGRWTSTATVKTLRLALVRQHRSIVGGTRGAELGPVRKFCVQRGSPSGGPVAATLAR